MRYERKPYNLYDKAKELKLQIERFISSNPDATIHEVRYRFGMPYETARRYYREIKEKCDDDVGACRDKKTCGGK